LSQSFYGTSDQGGNLYEWNESRLSSQHRVFRGGAMQTSALTLESSFRTDGDYSLAGNIVGFRVATVPAVLLGDFNGDGREDAADYIAWRKTDGTPADYNTWRTHFGQPPGSGATGSASASPSAIPEPASLPLFLLAIMEFLTPPHYWVAAKNRC
jgi:hypothetical protein